MVLRQAMVTGTSVLGVVFDGGVAMAADTLGSYGKMARYKGISRLYSVNNRTLLGFSGDLADFQYLQPIIETKQVEMENFDPKATLSPKALHSWLTAVMYNRCVAETMERFCMLLILFRLQPLKV